MSCGKSYSSKISLLRLLPMLSQLFDTDASLKVISLKYVAIYVFEHVFFSFHLYIYVC